MCRLCGERSVPPAREKARDYRCSWCRRQTPAQQAVFARYNKSEKGRAVYRRNNAKRIFVGRQYHSYAPTAALARVINTHIKERRSAFIKAQNEVGQRLHEFNAGLLCRSVEILEPKRN